MYGWRYSGGWDWQTWLATSLIMLVFWAVVAMAVVMIVRYLQATPGPARGLATGTAAPGGADHALGTLDERFARGDIDAEEYISRRERLVQP